MAISFAAASAINPNEKIGLIWIADKYTLQLKTGQTFGGVADESMLRGLLLRQLSDAGGTSANVVAALNAPSSIRVSAPRTGRHRGDITLGKHVGVSYGGRCKVGIVIAERSAETRDGTCVAVVAFGCGDIREVPMKTFDCNEFLLLGEDGQRARPEQAPPSPAATPRGQPKRTGGSCGGSEDEQECPVCYDLFGTQRQLRRVECVACGKAACRRCVCKHLSLSQTEAKCMHCDATFSRTFLLRNMGSGFVTGPYRKIRKRRLYEQEKARMPNTMGLVPAYKAARSTRAQIRLLRQSYADTMRLYESNNDDLDYLDIQTRLRDINAEMGILRRLLHNSTGILLRASNSSATKGDVPRRSFRHACAFENCRGFLSTAWHCPVCERRTCRHCFAPVMVGGVGHRSNGSSMGDDGVGEKSGGGVMTTEHVCREEALQSAQMIRRETKNCPSCAARIFKIDGCDQMWCTQCKVAFSWKTGRRVLGRVHNPHYFEWRRTHEDGRVPDTIVRVAANQDCANAVPATPLIAEIAICIESARRRANIPPMGTKTSAFHRLTGEIRDLFVEYMHFRHEVVVSLQDDVRRVRPVRPVRPVGAGVGQEAPGGIARNNAPDRSSAREIDLRLRFITGDTTEMAFKTTLIKRDNMLRKRQRTLDVYQLVVAVVCDRFRALTLTPTNTCYQLANCVARIHQVVEFANKQLMELSRAYSNCVVGFFLPGHLTIEKNRSS